MSIFSSRIDRRAFPVASERWKLQTFAEAVSDRSRQIGRKWSAEWRANLFESGRASFGALSILCAVRTGDSNCAYDLAIYDEWYTPLNR
jgi:hypothetical protein